MNFKLTILFILLYYAGMLLDYFVFSTAPKIVFLNVGQGDSILLLINNSEMALVDGGPDLSVENTLLGKYIYPLCHLKKIYITHFHADHSKGIPNIFYKCLKSASTFNDVSVSSYDALLLANLLNLNKFVSIPSTFIKTVKFGNSEKFITSENRILKIYTLWPKDNFMQLSDENDRSLIQLIDYGTYEVLLTGDASGAIIEKALTPFVTSLIDGRLEVYKVPHHGSPTGRSLTVLETLKPIHCVISVGRNMFGHPETSVIKDMENYGCKVHRTDIEGDIEFNL